MLGKKTDGLILFFIFWKKSVEIWISKFQNQKQFEFEFEFEIEIEIKN
jgi:hypothetical protein